MREEQNDQERVRSKFIEEAIRHYRKQGLIILNNDGKYLRMKEPRTNKIFKVDLDTRLMTWES